jgi:hypothetical protein
VVLADDGGSRREVKEWNEFTVFIETCGIDEDGAVKGLLGGEPWRRARVGR